LFEDAALRMTGLNGNDGGLFESGALRMTGLNGDDGGLFESAALRSKLSLRRIGFVLSINKAY